MATDLSPPLTNAPRASFGGRRAPSLGRPVWWRRLLWFLGIATVVLYVLGVAAGYVWLRYARKLESVGLGQVALFRIQEIRHAMAAQHFAEAKTEWAAKHYQAAYVYYTAAVNQDPDNVAGRLEAARFLASVGGATLELDLLEEGLARSPDERELNQALFGVLLATGRSRHALELLRGKYAAGLSGRNAALLRTAELQATLAVDGGPAAKHVLDCYPGLRADPNAQPVVALVLWEAAERPEAIRMLSSHLESHPKAMGEYVQLAGWQQEAGQPADALRTALRACKEFPQEPVPRALVLEVISFKLYGSPEWQKQVAMYLRDFAGRPESVVLLAELAGRQGWLDLAHTLYEIGGMARPQDLGVLAFNYADALGRLKRWPELRDALRELDAQSSSAGNAYLIQLRERQIMAASLTGEPDNVREFARRLAALVRGDPDLLDRYRQRYLKLGLADAAAEFTADGVKPKIAAK